MIPREDVPAWTTYPLASTNATDVLIASSRLVAATQAHGLDEIAAIVYRITDNSVSDDERRDLVAALARHCAGCGCQVCGCDLKP
jgi:hypothetical protein